jgi:hypothetical protein
MDIRVDNQHRVLGFFPRPQWMMVWHVKRVFFPRRTITGKLARGEVLRRYDGRKWIYRKMVRATDICSK